MGKHISKVMKAFFLLLALNSVFGQWQVIPNDDTQCTENEEFTDCGSMCEPQCSNSDDFNVCDEACVPMCICVKGYIRSPTGECITEKKCDTLKNSECVQEAEENAMMMGAFVPACEENGDYNATQCWGSTGECWCAKRNGKEIAGTRGFGEPETDCEKYRASFAKKVSNFFARIGKFFANLF